LKWRLDKKEIGHNKAGNLVIEGAPVSMEPRKVEEAIRG
jgi:hypothetical protein